MDGGHVRQPGSAGSDEESGYSLEIILAEEDEDGRARLAAVLREDGHQVIEARDGSDLMANLAAAYLEGSEAAVEPLLIAGLNLPVAGSLSVLRALREQGLSPHFILLVALDDVDARGEAARLGVLAMLDRPVDVAALRSAVLMFARSRQSS